jgi:hypothetical protein
MYSKFPGTFIMMYVVTGYASYFNLFQQIHFTFIKQTFSHILYCVVHCCVEFTCMFCDYERVKSPNFQLIDDQTLLSRTLVL